MSNNQSQWHRFVRRFRRAVRAFESERTDTESMWTFHVRLTRDELDGGWTAECLDLPGCVSDGATQQEAVANLTDAIAEVIAVRMGSHVPELGSGDDADAEDRELALSI